MKKRRALSPKGGSAKARKKRATKRAFALWYLLLAASAILLGVVLYLAYIAPLFVDSTSPVERVVQEPGGDAGQQSAGRMEPAPPMVDISDRFEDATPPVRVAIVIDDIGHNIKRLRRLLAVDAEIAVAVLPHLRYSKLSAEEAHSRGWQVLLHLPMEPENSSVNNPGDGALYVSMGEAELVSVIEADLRSVPHVIGVNNHMGSRATADEPLMRTVLGVVAGRNLFFLDSRTTAKSVAPELMGSLGVRGGGRSIFLDNRRDREYIRGQVKELIRLARLNGTAIAIGHPYTETIDVLLETVPALAENGVEVVRLSELMSALR